MQLTPHHTYDPNAEETRLRKGMQFREVSELYDFEVDRIRLELALIPGERIGLQLPEGMRAIQFELVDYLQNALDVAIETIGDPCFGACDLNAGQFEHAGISKVIHLGNAEMPTRPPSRGSVVCFVPLRSRLTPEAVLPMARSELERYGARTVGLASSVQYRHNLEQIRAYLENAGFGVHIGEGSNRVIGQGHVLGCDVSACVEIRSHVDCFAMFETGEFHAPFISLATKADVFCFDLMSESVRLVQYSETLSDWLQARESNHARLAMDQRLSVGIVASSKSGQSRDAAVNKILKACVSRGHQAQVLVCDFVHFETVESLGVDLVVNTACPRILDHRIRLKVPMMSVTEALEFFVKGRLRTEVFVVDEIRK